MNDNHMHIFLCRSVFNGTQFGTAVSTESGMLTSDFSF